MHIGGIAMSIRLSELYGLDIYTQNAKFVGSVEDIIVDSDEGKVVRLITERIKNNILTRDNAEQMIRKSVGYNKVLTLGDIVIVSEIQTMTAPTKVIKVKAAAREKKEERSGGFKIF